MILITKHNFAVAVLLPAVAVYPNTPLVPSSSNEMKYCHACSIRRVLHSLEAHVEQLETHEDVLNDKAERNWAVSKSDHQGKRTL